jgi:hypothetical protein
MISLETVEKKIRDFGIEAALHASAAETIANVWLKDQGLKELLTSKKVKIHPDKDGNISDAKFAANEFRTLFTILRSSSEAVGMIKILLEKSAAETLISLISKPQGLKQLFDERRIKFDVGKTGSAENVDRAIKSYIIAIRILGLTIPAE